MLFIYSECNFSASARSWSTDAAALIQTEGILKMAAMCLKRMTSVLLFQSIKEMRKERTFSPEATVNFTFGKAKTKV